MSVATDRPRTDAVYLHPDDNIAVAARNLQPGLEVQHNGGTLTLAGRVGLGHKLALRPIKKGEAVTKYGQIIGFASQDIPAGGHVHVHNVAAEAFERDYAFCRDRPTPPAPTEPRYWMGYDRGDGRYGTRNYIAIISTVNCSASVSKWVADAFRGDALEDFPNVDGIVPLTHQTGCGMASTGEGINVLTGSDAPAPYGGAAFHDNRVWVRAI